MKLRSLFALAVVASTLAASTSYALDVTGTWAGKEKCAFFTGTAFSDKYDVTISITQTGTDLNFNLAGGFLAGNWNGVAVADIDDPIAGQVGLHPCSSSLNFGEAGAFVVKTDPTDGSGKLKGRITYISHSIEEGVTVCKFSVKRTNVANPAVAACP
ncbi:MAG TPA: hypothetical protein VN634_19125 [Candidatus Limnocylindrales bacterium]|nr:hypothetical protein [Candidatus Limnocylindrales bacterium]